MLAGCVQPDATEPNPLFGLCPQWTEAPGQQAQSFVLNATTRQASQVLAPQSMSIGGRAFDLLRIRIDAFTVTGAPLQVRGYNQTGSLLNWRDFRPEVPDVVPALSFNAGSDPSGHEFEVYLTAVSQDQPPHPGPVELRWTLDGNGTAAVAYTATFHYKVCGAALSAPSSAA